MTNEKKAVEVPSRTEAGKTYTLTYLAVDSDKIAREKAARLCRRIADAKTRFGAQDAESWQKGASELESKASDPFAGFGR
jgi:hypothetical protein